MGTFLAIIGIIIGVYLGSGMIWGIVSCAVEERRRCEEAKRNAERERKPQEEQDELRRSSTMGILRNLESIPVSSWRFAGQRSAIDGNGDRYSIRVFRTTTRNGLSVELHGCRYITGHDYGDWGHVYVDGTEIPRTMAFTSVIDSLSAKVEREYNKPDSDHMRDLLDKM